ncbi:MAG: tRNA pseudouridine(55) synthase TruB [Clostridiales Family XIII bacterium]|jgi:tRNA pseudouridine55 synthase|nr:tRNA pseudouridine(55) synthase TruB [Clostridiales Family XIII bacterium]
MNEINGIIIVDKPSGITSHDVVYRLRKASGIKRVGHSGTLDPMATGVLPVFFGKATRIIEYLSPPDDDAAKVYECTMLLGSEYDTLDTTGTLTAVHAGSFPGDSEIEEVLLGMAGESEQYPPAYSAVSVDGKRLYTYARRGEEIPKEKLRPRKIRIKSIESVSVNRFGDAPEASFTVTCSKGVYIRTLCSDAGRLLGCGGAMSALRRTASDGFSIENAVVPDNLKSPEDVHRALMPIDSALAHMPKVELDAASAAKFANGLAVNVRLACGASEGTRAGDRESPGPKAAARTVRVYSGEVLTGIGTLCSGQVRPKKVLR